MCKIGSVGLWRCVFFGSVLSGYRVRVMRWQFNFFIVLKLCKGLGSDFLPPRFEPRLCAVDSFHLRLYLFEHEREVVRDKR